MPTLGLPAASFARCAGLRIAYGDLGSGSPIIFLHGVGSTRDVWDQQLLGLSDRFHCIAAEYRGYGDSDLPPLASLAPGADDAQAISRQAFARDTFAVMDAAGIEGAHLCGCSLGGVVALECYALEQRRVRSLILVDTFAFYPRGAESVRERIDLLERLGMEAFAASRVPLILAPGAPPERIERCRAQLASIALDAYKAATRATWTGDYRALLPRISVPSLVMWGEHDAITPLVLSEELAQGIPGCGDVVRIAGAGHLPNVDQPATFNAAVARFVESAEHAREM